MWSNLISQLEVHICSLCASLTFGPGFMWSNLISQLEVHICSLCASLTFKSLVLCGAI